MSFDEQPSWLTPALPALRTTQIIVFAMISGTVVFLVVTLLMDAPDNQPGVFVTTLAAAVVAFALVGQWLIPWGLVQAGSKKMATLFSKGESRTATVRDDWVEALSQLFITRTVIKMAILEGAAMLTLFAYMLERQPMSLGCYAGAVTAMILQIPTTGSLKRWLESTASHIQNHQQFER